MNDIERPESLECPVDGAQTYNSGDRVLVEVEVVDGPSQFGDYRIEIHGEQVWIKPYTIRGRA